MLIYAIIIMISYSKYTERMSTTAAFCNLHPMLTSQYHWAYNITTSLSHSHIYFT